MKEATWESLPCARLISEALFQNIWRIFVLHVIVRNENPE